MITSQAELRVFWPILRSIAGRKGLHAFVIYVDKFTYGPKRESELKGFHNIWFTRSIYPLINSIEHPRRFVNAICLDHNLFAEHHGLGIRVVKALQAKGAKCICLQHGSVRRDNVEGQATSESTYQIVWGEYMHDSLIKDGRDSQKVFLTGNPMHDEWPERDEHMLKARFNEFLRERGKDVGTRRIVLVATCLRAEYDCRENSDSLYRSYIRKIYDSINPTRQFLVVKMHPNDSEDPNLYREELNDSLASHVEIIPPSGTAFSVYDLINLAATVITRASTIAEEALMFGRQAIAFDIFSDGPSLQLCALKGEPGYTEAIGLETNLAAVIETALAASLDEAAAHESFVRKAGFKLDGHSAERVINVMTAIARGHHGLARCRKGGI